MLKIGKKISFLPNYQPYPRYFIQSQRSDGWKAEKAREEKKTKRAKTNERRAARKKSAKSGVLLAGRTEEESLYNRVEKRLSGAPVVSILFFFSHPKENRKNKNDGKEMNEKR